MNLHALLNSAVNDTVYNHIFEMTPASLHAKKLDVLEDIIPDKKELKSSLFKLRNFYFIDNIKDFRIGGFLRWVTLKNDDDLLVLSKGGFLCKIDENGLVFRLFGNRHVRLHLTECLFFQKFRPQELIILSALEKIK